VRQHRQIAMTDHILNAGAPPPDIALTRLIDRHGTRAVLRALAAVLVRRRRRARADALALPDRLRRDIGLPERGPPAPGLRDPWP